MSLRTLVSRLEAELAVRTPQLIEMSPPASTDEIRLAERIYGAELTPEIIELVTLHNGYRLYPLSHYQLALPTTLKEAFIHFGTPLYGGPFTPRSTVLLYGHRGGSFLAVPLEGRYRGHVFRMNLQAHEYSFYVCPSIETLFESWLYFLDRMPLTVPRDYLGLVPVGSAEERDNGISSFDILLRSWPDANPSAGATLDDFSSPEAYDFVRQHQLPYGFDPRILESHPDHDRWHVWTFDDAWKTYEGLRDQFE